MKKDVREFAFKCRVTEQWNHFSMIDVEAPTLNTFKNRVDKLWKDIMYNNANVKTEHKICAN